MTPPSVADAVNLVGREKSSRKPCRVKGPFMCLHTRNARSSAVPDQRRYQPIFASKEVIEPRASWQPGRPGSFGGARPRCGPACLQFQRGFRLVSEGRLGVSLATVERSWRVARRWLAREIGS